MLAISYKGRPLSLRHVVVVGGGGALQYEMLRCMKFQTSDSTLGLMTPYLQAFFLQNSMQPPPPSSLPMPLTPSGSGVANRPSVALADRKK